jgi:hypothetical protein
MGHKQRVNVRFGLPGSRAMSALLPKADIDRRLRNVRFVPIADTAGILLTLIALSIKF